MKNFSYLTKRETTALNSLISRLKCELPDYLIQIRFFGSKAKSNFKPDSDIDILLIVKERTEKVLDKIAEIHFDVDFVIVTIEEAQNQVKNAEKLIVEIERVLKAEIGKI